MIRLIITRFMTSTGCLFVTGFRSHIAQAPDGLGRDPLSGAELWRLQPALPTLDGSRHLLAFPRIRIHIGQHRSNSYILTRFIPYSLWYICSKNWSGVEFPYLAVEAVDRVILLGTFQGKDIWQGPTCREKKLFSF